MKNIINITLMALLLVGSTFGTTIDLIDNSKFELSEEDELDSINLSNKLQEDLDELETISSLFYDEVLGLNIDGNYYTVAIKDDQIQKIELNGLENADISLTLNKSELFNYIQNEKNLNWIQKARYWVQEVGVPIKYVLNWQNLW